MKRRAWHYWAWWHRLRGHKVEKGYGLLSPSTAYHCVECGLTWTVSLL